MKNDSQNINTIYNIFGLIVRNGISFFSIPFFASALGAAQYGVVSAYKAWIGIFVIVLGLQVDGSIISAIRYFDSEQLKKYISSILAFGLFFSSLCIGIGCLMVDDLEKMFSMSPTVIKLMGIQTIGTFVISFSSVVFIYLKQAKFSFLIQLVSEITGLGLSLYLLVFHFSKDTSYLACIYGSCIPSIVLALVLSIYFFYLGKWSFRFEYIRFCLPISIPLIFHGLSGIVMGQSDRLMIYHMIGDADAGIYSFISLFSSALSMVWMALNNSWTPFYFDDLRDGRIDLIQIKSCRYIKIYCCILSIFLLWSPEVIQSIVSSEYFRGIEILPILVLSCYFSFLYGFPANFQFYHMRTHYIALATTASACLNVGLNYFAIPYLGIKGAAITTLISYIAKFLFHEYVASHIIPAPYHYNLRFFLPSFLGVCLILALFYVCFEMTAIRWGLGFLFVSAFFWDIYRRKSIF